MTALVATLRLPHKQPVSQETSVMNENYKKRNGQSSGIWMAIFRLQQLL